MEPNSYSINTPPENNDKLIRIALVLILIGSLLLLMSLLPH